MMQQLTVKIKTLSPVILTGAGSSLILTASKTLFSGTALRGILASRYIQQNNLGTAAQDDAIFHKLFLDKVRFVDALPAQNNAAAIVLPLSLMKDKSSGTITDTLDGKFAAGYKALKGMGWVNNENGNTNIAPAEVQRTITFHMSRNGEEERISGHSIDGKVYNYEAIDRGQTFIGTIIGEESDLEDLLLSLNLDANNSCQERIGRSKYTQYGLCQFTFSQPAALPTLKLGHKVALCLATPLLVKNGTALNAAAILRDTVANALQEQTGNLYTIENICAASYSTDSFVGVWNMWRPRQYGLAAGSVFVLTKADPWTTADEAALKRILYGGIGVLCQEGFGQIRLWQHGNLEIAQKKALRSEPINHLDSDNTKSMLQKILKKKLLERVRLYALSDAEKSIKKLDNNKAHAFARLESMLGARSSKAQQAFYDNLLAEERDQSPFYTMLKELKISGKTLWDLLRDTNMYNIKLVQDNIDGEKSIPQDLLSLASLEKSSWLNDAFYEYWLWFFRHGRKLSVQKAKAEVTE